MLCLGTIRIPILEASEKLSLSITLQVAFLPLTQVHGQATISLKRQILTYGLKAGSKLARWILCQEYPFSVSSSVANGGDTMYRLAENYSWLQHSPVLKGEDRCERTS